MLGKARELFVVEHLQNANLDIRYSQIGDFQVGDVHLEVGGKNKTPKQLKESAKGYVLCDDILTADKRSIPLFLLGFLKREKN